jgi:hypothetical protein
MSKMNLGKVKYLDGERLFRLYFEEMGTAGSMAKLVNFCVSEGKKNPKTGKPPTRMSVWKAMWTWALLPENLATARKIFDKNMSASGEFYSDAEWKEFVFTKAKGGVELGKKKYNRFEEAIK